MICSCDFPRVSGRMYIPKITLITHIIANVINTDETPNELKTTGNKYPRKPNRIHIDETAMANEISSI